MQGTQIRMSPRATRLLYFGAGLLCALISAAGIAAWRMAPTCRRSSASLIALDSLQGKIESFELDIGRPPTSLNELLTSNAPNWQGPYARVAELRDLWGHPIVFEVLREIPGDCVRLTTLGPDGKPGGEVADTVSLSDQCR